MLDRVYICEKPDQGKNLAKALGWAGGNKGSYIENGKTIIIWGFGHLLSQAKPETYKEEIKTKGWDLSVLPVIPEKWIMEAPNPKNVSDKFKKNEESKLKQLERIGNFIGKTNDVVIATDFDREGESIAWEILEYYNYKGGVKRMKFTSLHKAALLKSHSNMLEGSERYNSYLASLARMRADWLMGMNVTMALTAANSKFIMRGDVLSAGRVQSPLVYLVVKRELEIKNFKSLKFFDIHAEFKTSKDETYTGKLKIKTELLDKDNYLSDETIAKKLKSELVGQKATIDDYVVKSESTESPIGYTLDDLQNDGVNKYGYSIQQVLELAQSLYEKHKITSYPRTDCGYLEVSSFHETKGVIETVKHNMKSRVFDDLTSKTNHNYKSNIWNDKKVQESSHHAIIPNSNKYDLNKLNEDEKRIYDLICRRYLMQFLGKYEYDSTKIKTKIKDEIFETSGNTPKNKGWKIALLNTKSDSKDELPVLKKGEEVESENITLKEGKTKPPSYYTEGTLLADMVNVQKFIENPKLKKIIKKGGIGTNATRASHLENMVNKKYTYRDGKKVRPTDKAMAINDILPNELRQPETTAYWEEALDSIENGKMTLDKFMSQQHNILKRVIEKIKNGDCDLKSPVSGGKGKIYTCEKCKSICSRIISKKTKKPFWVCSDKEKCNSLYEDNRGKLGKLIEIIKQPEGDHRCPTCNQKIMRRQNKENKSFFWVCSDKSCNTFCQDKNGILGDKVEKKAKQTSNFTCPTCNSGKLVLRNSYKGNFWGCNAFPKCKTLVNDKDGKPEGF